MEPTKIQNTQKITKIVMRPKAICFCPLGNDWYTNEFEVEFAPNECYPDYCFVEKFLDKVVRGKSLIIEDAVSLLYEYLEGYNPSYLKVTSNVYDVTSHSPVSVTKE